MEIGSVVELEKDELYYSQNECLKADASFFRLPFMRNSYSEYRTVFFQSTRNAIELLAKMLKTHYMIDTIMMPDYICDSVTAAVARADVNITFYKVDRFLKFDLQEIDGLVSENSKCAVYMAHLFGVPFDKDTNSYISKWKKKGVFIIEDITMNLFSDTETIGFGDYILGSIRKWLPIPDGGFVTTRNKDIALVKEAEKEGEYAKLYAIVQKMKREYIEGEYTNKELKNQYLEIYYKAIDILFSDYEPYKMSDISYTYINNYDPDRIMRVRKDNHSYLLSKLDGIDGLQVLSQSNDEVPFGLVICVDNRDRLLKYLIDNDIYCNVHWRLEANTNNEDIDYLSHHVITIPCDQRYSHKEMDYIAYHIRKGITNDCV